jgi:cystathionine gamma-synthase
MSAIHLVTTVFLKPGDLLVAPHDCYGGSYRLFDSLAKRGCYRVLFVDQNDEQALKQALAEKPKLVLVESPSNPLLRCRYCENLSARKGCGSDKCSG